MNPRSTLTLAGVAAILVGLALAVACAAHHQPYVNAAKVTLGISSALKGASGVADAAYGANVISGAQLNHTRAVLEPIAKLTLDAEVALQSWTGDGIPPQVSALVNAIADGIRDLTAFLPDGTAKTAILAHLATAQLLAETILGAFTGGGQ